ncbi:MAG: hypothetical protein JWM33_1040 [Caulobacteraceae bacterium]|nr:hypothetical protein [Caulobacteraceae bacterium]
MRCVLSLLCAALVLMGASSAQAKPAWWKISNGAGAVLWVLGMPDGMLTSVK